MRRVIIIYRAVQQLSNFFDISFWGIGQSYLNARYGAPQDYYKYKGVHF